MFVRIFEASLAALQVQSMLERVERSTSIRKSKFCPFVPTCLFRMGKCYHWPKLWLIISFYLFKICLCYAYLARIKTKIIWIVIFAAFLCFNFSCPEMYSINPTFSLYPLCKGQTFINSYLMLWIMHHANGKPTFFSQLEIIQTSSRRHKNSVAASCQGSGWDYPTCYYYGYLEEIC